LNRLNPAFDSFYVRFYKNLAATAMAITFAMVFSLFVYPTLARRLIRLQISTILRQINDHFFESVTILSAPASTGQPIPQESMKKLQNTHLKLTKSVQALQPLLVAAAAELRLEGRFKFQVYRSLLQHLNNLLDRLNSARVCLGSNGMDIYAPNSKTGVYLRELKDRLEMPLWEVRETVRLLLYIYSAALVAKHPLPHELPRALIVRNKVFEEYLDVVDVLAQRDADATKRIKSMVKEEKCTTPSHDAIIVMDEDEVTQSQGEYSLNVKLQQVEPPTEDEETLTLSVRQENELSKKPSRSSILQFEIVPKDRRSIVSTEASLVAVGEDTSASAAADSETLREILGSESWLRYLSFTVAMRMCK
jgi:hypothetical protein